jgi:catechol 2,3-dioxygenase-like lactoylglutathione lyase family enzyme
MSNTAVTYQPSHFGICVTDLERSLRFYCDGLGFKPAERYELQDSPESGLDRALEVASPVDLVSQFIRNGDMAVELLYYRSPQPFGSASASRGQIGITHLSFYVDDVDAAAAKLVANGGSLLPATRANPGTELVFVADPDGVRVELMKSDG